MNPAQPPRVLVRERRQAELEELLMSLFSGEELREFVRELRGREAPDLPGPDAHPRLLAFEVVLLLDREQRINDHLFKVLLSRHPDDVDKINKSKVAWYPRFVLLLCSFIYSATNLTLGLNKNKKNTILVLIGLILILGFAFRVNIFAFFALYIIFAFFSLFFVLVLRTFLTPSGTAFLFLKRKLGKISRVWEVVSTPLESLEGTDLRTLLYLFFDKARRRLGRDGQGGLMAGDAAVGIAQGYVPSIKDIQSLKVRLQPAQPAFFVHHGQLPELVSEALDRVRADGNPILSLSADVILSALADSDAAGVLAELEQRNFQQQNLYLQRNAIIDRRFFYGRSALLNRAGSALQRGESLFLTGFRKVGKTSSLHILRQSMAAHPVCWIDLQKYNVSRPGWPIKLFAEVVEAYDRWGRTSFQEWPFSAEAPEDAAALEKMLAARRGWQEARGRTERLVVILDEIERIFPRSGQQDRVERYVEATGGLRALAQSAASGRIALVAADLRPTANRVDLLPGGDTNPLYSFFHELPLGMLDADAVAQMMIGIGRPMGISGVEQAFIEEIFALSGGHPFLARLLAGEAAEHRDEPQRLSRVELQAGLGTLSGRGELGSFCSNLWSALTPEEQAVLLAVVQDQPLPSSPAAVAFLQTHGLLSEGQVTIGVFREWLQENAADLGDRLGA